MKRRTPTACARPYLTSLLRFWVPLICGNWLKKLPAEGFQLPSVHERELTSFGRVQEQSWNLHQLPFCTLLKDFKSPLCMEENSFDGVQEQSFRISAPFWTPLKKFGSPQWITLSASPQRWKGIFSVAGSSLQPSLPSSPLTSWGNWQKKNPNGSYMTVRCLVASHKYNVSDAVIIPDCC